ncbi:MAG TPA: saccharopine dehydrogenase C-terminal domain-containing protein [Edaphocola sp.]|nr:saccharopine dehydrogenase C-terminal domain-containing protein [Edaphocola sp.]
MKNILIAGAGKSSSYLIKYLLDNSKPDWRIVVMDASEAAINEKTMGHPRAIPAVIEVTNSEQRQALVKDATLVVSILPPDLHYILAKDCLMHKKHLITSSYISPEIKAMDEEVKKAGLMFMCEMGLDPGIDHMSAMAISHSISKIAGTITSFKSFCGGVIAPESDNNPWHYKISWNPRNVVLSGKAGAEWKENGIVKQLEYPEIFANNKRIKVDGVGMMSYYPNRDSLDYIERYGLHEVENFMRATLRFPSFSKAWNYIVKMGLTQDDDQFDTIGKSYADWISFKTGVPIQEGWDITVAEKYMIGDKSLDMIKWLGLFEASLLIKSEGTFSSADILQDVIEDRWRLMPNDKDMIVMQHQIVYQRKKTETHLISNLVVKGENKLYSAMAKTVGLPMAILAKKIIDDGKIPNKTVGVQIPIMPDVYRFILKELKKNGISFEEVVN